MVRNLLLLSNSTLHGSGFLEWASEMVKEFLNSHNVKEILFIPYALQDHNKYTEKVYKAFTSLGFELSGIHTHENPVNAVEKAQALYIGGGNTFRLLKTLYDKNLIDIIRKRVLEDGMPYIGISAGTNVATVSINTTNDMPIVYPPSFEALKLVPFNINPHYVDPSPENKHMGETREERINQYHEESSIPVLGLREGSLLHVTDNSAKLRGLKNAKLFMKEQEPKEFEVGSDLSFLLHS
ncbi:UNVERIFIED_CONTAM: hypothetical protein RMT77_010815 [Armadillidium vulgare]